MANDEMQKHFLERSSLSKNFTSHLALLSVALIYGANYIIAKGVMNDDYIPSLAFIFFRVAFGIVSFAVIALFFLKEKIERSDWPRLFLCGLLGVATNQMFFFMGLELTSPIHASLIMLTTPLIVLIAAGILLKEAMTSRKFLGIALGACGAGLLIYNGDSASGVISSLRGDLFILINATSYGLYLVVVRPLIKKYHPITIVAGAFAMGGLIALPIGGFYIGQIDWASFSTNTWLSFGYVLLFTTVIAYLLNAFALKNLNSSTVSIYIYLQPLIAGSLSIFIGQDALSLQLIIAAILIFFGVYLVSVSRQN